jgi:hypothetical protein
MPAVASGCERFPQDFWGATPDQISESGVSRQVDVIGITGVIFQRQRPAVFSEWRIPMLHQARAFGAAEHALRAARACNLRGQVEQRADYRPTVR